MKVLSKIFLLGVLSMLSLSACGGDSTPTSVEPGPTSQEPESSETSVEPSSSEEKPTITSDTLYVKKVENLPDSFYCGMDVSSVIALENGGTKFYDFEGNETDLFKVLADNGVNLIRVRIWNDPFNASGQGYGGGNCDINTAVAIGKRATQYGMKLLANFHYSDSWADPGRQLAPKAWKNLVLQDRAAALYTYTKQSLQTLKNEGVDVGIVQVGNETNNFYMAGLTGIENFSVLFGQGSRAVREVYPEAKVAVHFTNPEKQNNYQNLAAALDEYHVDYDVFGSSYYPFFHGTLSNLQNKLNNIAQTYDKEVMVMETSYAYTDEDTDQCGNQFSSTSNYTQDYPVSIAGQANNFRNVVNAVNTGVKNGKGIGVVYWEGAWITASPKRDGESDVDHWTRLESIWSQYGSGWSSKYASEFDPEAPVNYSAGTVVDNQAFFDQYGHPIESLKVFGLVRTGNTDVPTYIDGAEKTTVKFNTNDTIVLPENVNVIRNTNKRDPLPVTWETYDYSSYVQQGPGSYEINGVIAGDDGKEYPTVCTLTLTVSENLIRDYSFENGGKNDWTLTKNNPSDGYQLKFTNADANNPISGKWSCHAYTPNSEVNFDCTQTLTLDEARENLTFVYNITGGANANPVPTASQNIYGYIKDSSNNLIVTVPGYITKWGDIWKFDETGVNLPAGTYTVGIHVEVDSAGTWVDLDDISLY